MRQASITQRITPTPPGQPHGASAPGCFFCRIAFLNPWWGEANQIAKSAVCCWSTSKTFVFTGSIALDVLRDAKEVIALINQAFHDVQRGAITLTEADVIDVYGDTEERLAARLLDTESHWTEIPDSRPAS